MLRVCEVMGQMNGGGVESVVMNYYRHIDRDKVQLDFIVDANSERIPEDEIEALGGRIFLVPPLKQLSAHQKELARLFASEAWPIVHSHRNTLSVFPLKTAAAAGVPVRIAHSHSTSGQGEHARNLLKYTLKRFANVYPTERFACSVYAGKWLFGEDADFEVIYNAIDLDSFVFDADARVAERAALGIADDQLVLGHVGRFMTQKNHAFLIRAFARLSELRDDCVLVCAGEGELKAAVEQQARDAGIADKVRFLGQRPNINKLYQAFDAFVLPSIYEGLPLVAVEAQMAGLPCFMSDVCTRELDLTHTVEFLPITDESIWAERLAGLSLGPRMQPKREDFDDYDIRLQGARLTARYLELAEGVQK